MLRRMPSWISSRLLRGFPCWLLRGFLSGMLCGPFGGSRSGRNDGINRSIRLNYHRFGNTDRGSIVGVVWRVAVLENPCASDIENRDVLAKGIGSILVEIVPVVQYGVLVRRVTDAVCLAPGTGTWASSTIRPNEVLKGSSWGFCGAAGTRTGLVRVEIDWVEHVATIDRIGGVFLALQ